jgi:hypothetical protein
VKALRNLAPGVARRWPGIDAVGDDRTAGAEIVTGDGLRDLISHTFDHEARSAHWLLNRVDAQPDRSELAGGGAGDRGLPRAGQSAQ